MTERDRGSLSRCLADDWRRAILDYLRDADDGTASLDELVEHVLEREANAPALDQETATYELYHVHLPVLADHDVIDYDERAETVRFRASPEIERVIDRSAP